MNDAGTEFMCDVCKGKFLRARSDDAAMKESADRFGELQDEPLAIVCDVCFKEMGRFFGWERNANERKDRGVRH